MLIDLSTLASDTVYHLMTQVIIPRPIAWVLTDNGTTGDNGQPSYNLAPFSYFNAIASSPPLVVMALSNKPDGSHKDTRRNIAERGHYVVHIPRHDQAHQVSDSAATLAHGESELARLQLATTAISGFPLPRLTDCAVAMACRLYQLTEIGNTPQALIIGQIEQLYVDPAAVTEHNGRVTIDPAVINPLARLGANQYAAITAPFKLDRPA